MPINKIKYFYIMTELLDVANNLEDQLNHYFGNQVIEQTTEVIEQATEVIVTGNYRYFVPYEFCINNGFKCKINVNQFGVGYANNEKTVMLSNLGELFTKKNGEEKKNYQAVRSFHQVRLHIDENDKLVVILGRLKDNGTESNLDEFAIHTDETIDKTAVPFIKINTEEQVTITMIKEPFGYETIPGYIGGTNTLDTPCLKGCFPLLNDPRSKCATQPHGLAKSKWDYCDLQQPPISKRKEIIKDWNTNNPTKLIKI